MSASLVGSEMCIRDSPFRGWRCRARAIASLLALALACISAGSTVAGRHLAPSLLGCLLGGVFAGLLARTGAAARLRAGMRCPRRPRQTGSRPPPLPAAVSGTGGPPARRHSGRSEIQRQFATLWHTLEAQFPSAHLPALPGLVFTERGTNGACGWNAVA
eukprot:12846147-Alexandrium_andersonii.AAC.1